MSSLPLVGGRMAMAPRLSRRPVVALLPRRATTIQSRRCLSSRNDHDSQKQQQQQQKQEQQQSGKVTWYPIPVGLGIACIGLLQIYKVSTREDKQQAQQTPAAQAQQAEADASQQGSQATNPDETKKPKRRPRVRPDGPWQVQVMSTLPLKAMSRLWGRINELTIPYYLRVPGFKLYSYIFGVNLSEVAEDDLRVYPNLAAFFYRQLKPGARPLHPDPHMLLSPSDGRVLQFGQIEGGDIEQVKGMTYSIDALLGKNTPSITSSSSDANSDDAVSPTREASSQEDIIKRDQEFAKVNGIPYTLPELLTGSGLSQRVPDSDDMSTPWSQSPVAEAAVGAQLAQGSVDRPWHDVISGRATSLYYAVVYLAPGDYHRFHSPTDWVVERRRHFAGELYSVSPYLQRTLPGLFTLNERVVLLGRWRWGFFSYIPVGATNVGSIKVNFDRELRTNSLTTDTAADRAAEDAARRGEPYLGFAEASYQRASRVLGGHALRRGDEMGGFQLGSTVVLVFEAPAENRGDGKKGWEWAVNKGQLVKMGQALGRVVE